MRIEILRQMTDDEVDLLFAYIFAYIDFIQSSIAEDEAHVYYDEFQELLLRARKDIRNVARVQEERRKESE